MVPLILFLLFSNWSFIFSVRVVESRISSPMRWVNYQCVSNASATRSVFAERRERQDLGAFALPRCT